MSTNAKALIAAFLFTAAAPVPALAAQSQQAQQPAAKASQLQPSKEARPALAALQKAANENRIAEIPALAQAALAVAKNPSDRYLVHQLQLKPAVAANNQPMQLAALEGMIASGVLQGSDLALVNASAAKLHHNNKNFDRAGALLEQAIALAPTNADLQIELYRVRNSQKRPAEAVAALQRAQALKQQAGQPADPAIADQIFALAVNNRLPMARDLAMERVKRSPDVKNWRLAIKLFEEGSSLSEADKLDLYRLQRVTGSLEGERDHGIYVDTLLLRGLPGEATAVLDEAFAAGRLDKNKPLWRNIRSQAASRVSADRASLAAGERTALAVAAARPAVATADALLSYGEFARAAALYRAALGKSGADADLVNLRLGIALARSGDRAGATTAFNAVKGSRAGIAQMWLTYLQTQQG